MNNLLKKIRFLLKGNNLILNLNLDFTVKQKKVLIVYTHDIFYMNLEKNIITHTNIIEANQIINIFIKKNYCIDLIHCLDYYSLNKILKNKYDVIFGFGDIYKNVCESNKNAIKIVYLTENPPEISYLKEQERINYFKSRTGKSKKISRSGKFYTRNNIAGADYGIILGELELYKNYIFNKFSIKPTGFYNDNFIYKDNVNSKNFLWFGSAGAIHKGLDILIDVFKNNPDYTLNICGLTKKDKKIIKNINLDNIKLHGFVNVKSDKFLELVDDCLFTILPSCSEGFSTSIATCMRHGMIPVVQKDIGFNNLQEYCFILDNYDIEYITNKIREVSSTDMNILRKMREKIYTYSNKEFTIKNYTKSMNRIIENIL